MPTNWNRERKREYDGFSDEPPKCGERMKKRTNQTTGKKFWGCSEYPACRGTLEVIDA